MARVSFGSRRRSRNGRTAVPAAGVNRVNRSGHVSFFYICFNLVLLEREWKIPEAALAHHACLFLWY